MAKKKKKEIETGRILGRINDDGSITPFIQKQQEEEIAPVKDTWLKKGALNDSGYAIQNPLDAINRFNASILMTGVDALGQFGKGFLGSAEGVSDIAKTTTADVLDFFGADNKAKKLRKSAEKTWGINEELDKSLIDDNGFGIDDMSLLGQKGKSVPQGLGTTMFSMTTGSVLGGAGGMALLGLSAAGNSEQEAIKEMKANQDINGFSDKEIYKNAKLYGLLSGTAEAATEMMFGAAAQGSNLLGIGTGAFDSADDAVINALTKKISNKLVKTFTQAGLKASSEGIEEVASGMLDALAKKITYQKDKKYWTELLKDENLLDSFLSGTFSAALSQAPSVARNVTTTENGKVRLQTNDEIRDFITNLNAQEQQVVEREVENRVNQEEKVTKKRRAEIQKQVIEDLDRGYINANTIRDVLGENYNAERDVRLNESFNEETRRTQAYENDVSKYDEKQRKTIQTAIDSGLLNNSNKTHDFVDLIAKLSADKGIDFDFTNNQRIKDTGFAVEGKTVNGFIKDGKVTLNLESNQVLNKTVGHEITHVLEGTELYNSLQDSLKSFIGEREWNNRISELEKTYKDVKGANIENELTSDLVGEYVFNDEKFVKSLSTRNPNLFQKIFDEIKYMVKIATAGSKEARDLEKVKRAFEKAYRETSKTQKGTQYSLSTQQQLNDITNQRDSLRQELLELRKERGEITKTIPDYSMFKQYDELTDINKKIDDNLAKSKELYAKQEELKNKLEEEKEIKKKQEIEEINKKSTPFKEKQFKVLQKSNPMLDDYHTGIRQPGEIMTWEEAINDADESGEGYSWGDYTKEDALRDLDRKKVTIYSSYPIKNGTFVTPSRAQAEMYAGGEGSSVYSKTVNPDFVAWINVDEGQYANVGRNIENNTKYSLSEDNQGRQLSEQQQEFFKDSKVRDNEGRLLEVYHGTDEDFNEFKYGGGEHGDGYYFTEDYDYAEEYSGSREYNDEEGRIVSAYLDLKNPLAQDVDLNSESMQKFMKGIEEKWGLSEQEIKDCFKNYNMDWSSDLSSKVAEKMGYGINDVESTVGFEIDDPEEFGLTDYNAYLGAYAWDNGLNQLARESGFDGIISRIYNADTEGYEYIAFNSNQIKNVDNTNPTSNPDIRYSLSVQEANTTQDNEGRKLTDNQLAYFKDSKAVDENGNLVTVYHTMTNAGEQFNEFNPVGTEGYRFGDQVVNYYTNSKDMSGSYADSEYEMADTKRVENIKEAKDLISNYNTENETSFEIANNSDGTMSIVDNTYANALTKMRELWENEFSPEEKARLKEYGEQMEGYIRSGYDNSLYPNFGSLDKVLPDISKKIDNIESNLKSYERDIFSHIRTNPDGEIPSYIQTEPVYVGTYNTENELLKDVKSALKRSNSIRANYQYEGYANLKNPYIVDAENRNWNAVETKENEFTNKIKELSNESKELLKTLSKDSEKVFRQTEDNYLNLDKTIGDIKRNDTLPKDITGMAYVIQDYYSTLNDFLENQYLSSSSSNMMTMLSSLRNNGLITLDEYVDYSYDGTKSNELRNKINDIISKEFEFEGSKYTLKELSNDWHNAMAEYYQKYNHEWDYFYEEANKRIKELNDEDYKILDDLFIEANNGIRKMYLVAKDNFDVNKINSIFGDSYTTNDIVKRVIDMNNNGYNYDGVIIKNTRDYGGEYKGKHTANDLYITFNSNQFKAVDNLNPTDDADIRYQLGNNEVAPTSGWNVRSEDVRLQSAFKDTIAPLQEQVQQLTDTITRLEDKIAPIKEEREDIETRSEGFVIDKINDLLWRLQGKKDRYFGLTKPDMELLRNTVLEDRQNRAEYLNDFINNLTQKIVDNSNADVNVNEIKEELSSNINDYLDEYRALTEQEADELYQETQRGFENEVAPIRENLTPEENQRMDMLELLERNGMLTDERRYEKEQLENKINPVYPTEEATPGQALSDIRDVNEVGSPKIKAYQYEHPEVKPYFREEARGMLSDLRNSQKGGRYIYESQERGQGTNYDVLGVKRFTSPEIAELLDSKYGYTYDDIRKGLNAIIEDHGAENIAIAKRIELVLDDNLRNGYTDWQTGMEVPPNQQYLNMLAEQEWQNYFDDINSQYPLEQLQEPQYNLEDEETDFSDVSIDNDIQNMTADDINIEPFLQGLVKSSENQAERQQLRNELNEKREVKVPKNPELNKAKNRGLGLLVNEFAEIDDYSKRTGNKNIKFKADTYNNYQAIAQSNIETAQTDINGKAIGRSGNSIFEEAKSLGLEDTFDEYLKQWANVDRAKQGKGAANYSAKESYKIVKEMEAKNPRLKKLGNDMWQYYRNARHNLRDAGIISQEVSDMLGRMYPHYTPYISENIENYFTDKGELKPKATIKRAKGGAAIGSLLSAEEAMQRYTKSEFNTIFGNDLFKEIVNTSNDIVQLGGDDRGMQFVNADNLYADKTGYYLTAYEDGNPITARISEDMYRTLTRESRNRISDIENTFSMVTKPLQAASKLRRNILTSWSPTFIAKNFIKDFQEGIFNSKYTKDFIKNYPSAFKELATNTELAQQFKSLYGSGLTMGQYDIDANNYNPSGKNRNFLKGIKNANELIELAPRFAEFKASIDHGASLQEAMYNAREVTTNFSRGGTLAKALNRNGFTFLNSSIQGFDKFIRNFSGENGAKGIVNSLAKAAIFGIAPAVFNELAFGSGDDKDEEYEALPDYIKDNYYIIKTGDGNFIRIPKGRVLSVFGSAARRTIEAMEGEKNAFEGYWNNVQQQIGINNPEENNIFAPFIQAMGGRKLDSGQTAGSAWYGGDIIPTRLQKEHPEDQHDASIDKFSIWLGQKTGISPYKINYVLDQYSGGIGDLALPMFTEEANSDADNVLEFISSGIKDQFKVDTITDNKYVSEFYDTYNKLYSGSKKNDEDVLKENYMTNISKQMGELYAERREIQADTTLSKKEKYEKAQTIKAEINRLAKEGLDNYENISITGDYADVDGQEYQRTDDGWRKLSSNTSDEVNSLGLTNREKNNYIKTQKDISSIKKKYKDTDDYVGKKQDIIGEIINTNLTDDAKMSLYQDTYKDKFSNYATDLGFDADTYLEYKAQDFSADKDKNGKSISGSKKRKVFDYVNSLDIPYEQKLLLAKSEYNSFNDNNYEIIEYIENSGMDYDERIELYKTLGFKVDGDSISW